MDSLREQVLLWLVDGEVGASSKTMALRAAGLANRDEWAPADPDDLRRCLLLLERIPAIRLAFDKIAAVSPRWAALIEHWDELEALFLEECGSLRPPRGTKAPKLYDRMRDVMHEPHREPGLYIVTDR